MHSEKQVPIWFFIGGMLLIYGVMISISGVYYFFCPPEHQVKLFYVHADIWWGAIMAVVGAFYVVRFNPLRDKS